MEPAQSICEPNHLEQIIALKDEIIKLQKIIIEKDEIIIKDKEIISDLRNKLKTNEIEKEDFINKKSNTPSKDFNILDKEIIFKENGVKQFYTIYILKDGRLIAGDAGNNIIIYNQNNFKPEITIKESNYIMYLTQLKNGFVISLLADGSINIYKLLGKSKYSILQKIKAHSARVHKLRVLDDCDNRFMTCSDDCTIKFFFQDKNEYKEDYIFKEDLHIFNILSTKEGEIVYSGYNSSNNTFIKFYDLKSRKIISSTNVKSLYNGLTDNLSKLCDTYLLVGGSNTILIFDVNQHKQIKEIESNNSSCITSFLKLNEKILLTADCNGNIKQWIIDEENLILENVKLNAHNGQIRMIRKNQDGLIITCSDDKSIKVWN